MINLAIPKIPAGPILPPDVTYFANIKISSEVILYLLWGIVFLGVSLVVGLILTKVMEEKSFKNNAVLNLCLTGAAALTIYFSFGTTVTAIQEMTLFLILLYASCSDITSHTVDDFLWVMVILLGISSISTVGLPSMLIGAAMVFAPQMLMAILSPKRTLGGADIKLSTAIAFLLGWQKGLAALIIGLVFAVVFMSIVQRINKDKRKQPFALIPFLSVGAVIMFLV